MSRTHVVKVFRDITARKTRTVLVALSVFVGVLGVVSLTTLGQMITRQLETNLHPSEMAMLRIFVNPAGTVSASPQEALDALRDYPGVTAVEGQAVYDFRWRRTGEDDFRQGYLYAYSEPYGQIELEPLRLRAGRFPREGEGEVALEQRMADKYGLDVGDSIVIDRSGIGTQTMRIVGLVFQPYLYVGGGDGTTSVFATYSDAQRLLHFPGLTSIFVRFQDFSTARQQSHAFRRTLMDRTPYRIVFYVVNNPNQNVFLVGVKQFSRTLTALAVLAMAVASILVTTVVGMIIAEQHAQIGAMKALGATRRDVLIIYLGIAFAYGLIGTVPALVLGVPIGRAAAVAAAPVANTILENTNTPLSAVVLGLSLGLGVPVLAALVPVLHGTQITILDAISDPGIRATYGHGLLPRLVADFPLPLTLTQSINNIIRHKARVSLILLTLIMAIGAFMGVYAAFRILDKVAGNVGTTLNYEVGVDPSRINLQDLMQSLLMEEPVLEIQRGVAIELEAQVETDNGGSTVPVPEAEPPQEEQASDLETVPVYVTGIQVPDDMQYIELVEGTAWEGQPDRPGMVITQQMADRFEKTVGDRLRMISPNNTADIEIIGISDFPLETAFMEWEDLAAFVGDIRDSPTPNAFWEQLVVEVQDGEDMPNELEAWALGVDETIGRLLVRGFSADQPGVIVSQSLAQQAGIAPGDTLHMRPPDSSGLGGLLEDQQTELPVLDVVRIRPQDLRVFASRVPDAVLSTQSPLLMAMYWETLASVVKLDYEALTPHMFSLDLANPEASRQRIDQLFTSPTPAYQNQVAFQDRITQTMLGLGLVMSVAASLMAVVGGIGLMTITFIGVFERQREIGVMRSIGATSRQIMIQFLLEGLLIGLLAWAIGIPLSYLLTAVLIRLVPFSDVISFSYTAWAPLIGLLGMLLVTGLATFYPALVASRRTVSDILRYQ